MASYKGKSRQIKDALVTVLSGIQLDSGSGAEPAFTSVTDNPEGEFDGYPILRVLPGFLDTTKSSVSQNERSVNYIARVHVLLETEQQTEQSAFNQLYDLTDLIIDTLDEADYHGTLNAVDQTLGTFMLNASRGDWAPMDTSAGIVMMMDVNIEVKYSRDLQ